MRSAGTMRGGLADEGGSALFEGVGKLREVELGVEAGDGFELVERAAGVAEGAAADHGDADAGDAGGRGWARPAAARMGAMRSEVLSPTPPVECLSTVKVLRGVGVEGLAGEAHGGR